MRYTEGGRGGTLGGGWGTLGRKWNIQSGSCRAEAFALIGDVGSDLLPPPPPKPRFLSAKEFSGDRAGVLWLPFILLT